MTPKRRVINLTKYTTVKWPIGGLLRHLNVINEKKKEDWKKRGHRILTFKRRQVEVLRNFSTHVIVKFLFKGLNRCLSYGNVFSGILASLLYRKQV